LWLASPSPEATRAAGQRLGEAIGREGAVIALVGPLGAGKTLFTKGLAEGLGLDPAALASPTFGIAHEYRSPGGRPLTHVDAYRLASTAELEAAGWLDWLAPGAVVVLEWGDRFPDALPDDHLRVELARVAGEPSQRRLSAVASGPASEALRVRWRDAFSGRGAQPGRPRATRGS